MKFNKHNVSNGTTKARVRYSLDNRIDGRNCVTIYAKDYGFALPAIFGTATYVNNTDSQQDYFEKGKVVLFEDHPLYAQAREAVVALTMNERKDKGIAMKTQQQVNIEQVDQALERLRIAANDEQHPQHREAATVGYKLATDFSVDAKVILESSSFWN